MTVKPRIGVVYLSEYRVALSSLAFHFMYGLLREYGVDVHRITLENGVPKDWDSRYFTPMSFDAFLVSVPYELMYKDLSGFLAKSGFKPFAAARSDNEPVVITGGPAVTGNPLPVAPLADAVLVGEAEGIMHSLMGILESDYSRKEKINKMSELDGVMVWANQIEPIPVKRVFAKDLDATYYPVEQIYEPQIEPIWGRSFLLEASRGCARGCLFCMEGRVFLPPRHRSFRRILSFIDEGMQAPRGLERYGEKVAFYSLSFFDHPDSDKILETIIGMGLKASIPSVRVDTLTEKRLSLIRDSGQKTLTLAPETGSCRLARVLRKNICRDHLVEVMDTALTMGIRQFKIYVMTGFYGELERDLRDTVEMINEAGMLVRKYGGRLKLSVNPLIPKPHTPLQWHGFIGVGESRRRIEYIRKATSRYVHSFSSLDPRHARLQTILSRGGPELAKTIALWGPMNGFLSSWRTVARETGLREEDYTSFWNPDYTPLWHEYVLDDYNKPGQLRFMYELFLSTQNQLSNHG